ncbi:alginate lyase [Parasphingopyxis sp. CP4]|uniref:polysaccharide lyase 6 family protein n=1 Tax=Parasphingopyxis sp. CP4 TaxID=2724527 RepID=UPI0015A17334|nr:polysaccharide lyase 6 family protein [Parasphingopyxis sp. CP4]QLC20781.1 alginate lyase [Parasphingopyxis sp. CP4]
MRLLIWLFALCALTSPLHAEDLLVRNQDEYAQALSRISAGDTIVLADGEWPDFEMAVTGSGRAESPITVRSETPGSVVLTGQSNLRIGGEHIVVSGLVFRDGYSPTGDVIAFRLDSDTLANNSRVTQTVIDNFSKPDRNETDYWVAIYGSNNRFDHNHLEGKTNRGVTLAVRLNTAESRNNNHRIDHNYFGPRSVLGSNGGETLRIGTSHYASFDSNTIVENNVFDRTDGEVEIISVKAGGNIVRGNLFLRSRGALTLRHGDGNLIEHNVFLGHGKDHTGGIRVINRNQTVRENYMEGLRGFGFSSAMAVMNGVPNSPANRYVQVQNAQIERNTIVDSATISLGTGADEERSAPPVDSRMTANVLGGIEDQTFIEVDSDISGIERADNVIIAGELDPALADIQRVETEMHRADNGLLYPTDPALGAIGVPADLTVISLEDVGVDWYEKPAPAQLFASGREIEVAATTAALLEAVAQAEDGDVLALAPGRYQVDRTLGIDRALTFVGRTGDDGEQAVLTFSRPSLFEIQQGGNLRLQSLVIDGSASPDSVGNSVIRTGIAPIRGNFVLELESVNVRGLTVNRDFDVIYLGPSTLADRIHITNSLFEDITGTVVSAAAEADDQGRYNVEYLDIENSIFRNVRGALAEVYRGGRDESTFGPHVSIRHSILENVGEASDLSLRLHGVQETAISENLVTGSAALGITHTVGNPRTAVQRNVFTDTPEPVLTELIFPGEPRVEMRDNVFSESESQ